MTRKEFAVLAMAIQAFYPRERFLEEEKAKTLWFESLKDIPFEAAELGLKKWVSIQKWTPSIADLREMAAEVIAPAIPDWGQAWAEVQKSIQIYGYYRPKEGVECLRPLTRQAVDRIGYINLCTSDNIQNDRANFRMIYEELAKREKEESKVPAELREKIRMLGARNEESMYKLPE